MLDAFRRFADSILHPAPINWRGRQTSQKRESQAAWAASQTPRADSPETELGKSFEPRPHRMRSGIEAELEKLRRRLDATEERMLRERRHARQSHVGDNTVLLNTLESRHSRLAARVAQLQTELDQLDMGVSCTRPSKRASRGLGFLTLEISNTDSMLAQAAETALRRARFARESERVVFQKLVGDLTGGSREVQLRVLERLAEIRSPASVSVLNTAVRHRDEEVRIAAMRGLLNLKDPSTRDIINSGLRDPSHRTRVWALRALYAINDETLPQTLCEHLNDPHPRVRGVAATYLGWARVVEAQRPLRRAIADPASEVRFAAVTALGTCGGTACIFRLLGALGDDSREVREATFESLQKLLGTLPVVEGQGQERLSAEKVAALRAWWRHERVQRLSAPPGASDPREGGGVARGDGGVGEPTAVEPVASGDLTQEGESSSARDGLAGSESAGREAAQDEPVEPSAGLDEEGRSEGLDAVEPASDLDGAVPEVKSNDDGEDGLDGLDGPEDLSGDLDGIDSEFGE